jgi:periplasmic protein TonB
MMPMDAPLSPMPSFVLDPASSPSTWRGRVVIASAAAHVVVVAALVLIPIFTPDEMLLAPESDYLRVLIYDPPPPPPPPLPKGSRDGARRPQPLAAPEPRPTPVPAEGLKAPVEILAPILPGSGLSEERVGSPTGSDSGVPEGMEEGVEGGVVGGLPGGVVGGVIGGTGTGPVPVYDYDRPPRLLRPTKPRYPHDAFVKKIQGVVVVEFVIDAEGRVLRPRVVISVPLLDEAALVAVRDWLFSPAIKNGRPVATVARAPVSFVIY